MFEVIAFSVYTIILGILVSKIFTLTKSNKIMQDTLAQCYIDKQIYIEQLSKEIESRENQNVENTDGFLNFVSASRDWAYEYIETVQDKLTNVFEEIDNTSDKKTAKKILAVVEQLRPLLPEGKGK
jgi:hypothetical protein